MEKGGSEMKQDSFMLGAPKMDFIASGNGMFQEALDNEILAIWSDIYLLMSCIKPYSDDEVRSIWIKVPRGTIQDFGDFREYKRDGEVKTRREFEQMWLECYPLETYWYKFTTSKYREEKFFFLNSQLIFSLKEQEFTLPSGLYAIDHIKVLLGKLAGLIRQEVGLLKTNPLSWNDNLDKDLPHKKRLGHIRRADFWKITGDDCIRLDKRLGKNRIKQFQTYLSDSGSAGHSLFISDITADDFFRFCEICYDANGYFKKDLSSRSPREKYNSMADGRDGGLLEVTGNSPDAFNDWFHNEKWAGSHPWEICRGGNSTHISLQVYPENSQWKLHLAGSSIGRVTETVKMAIALYNSQIPFMLSDAEAIGRMVSGTDFIGIVPDYIIPRYCHSFFPKEDRITDFMNLPDEFKDQIIPIASWYPLEKVELE
jgi:hypothetical protein